MGCWLNSACIELIQLFHVTKDAAKLGAEHFLLFIGKGQPGKERNVFDLSFGYFHDYGLNFLEVCKSHRKPLYSEIREIDHHLLVIAVSVTVANNSYTP
jgi:hypothetical protein